jgi:hypothetical protein
MTVQNDITIRPFFLYFGKMPLAILCRKIFKFGNKSYPEICQSGKYAGIQGVTIVKINLT